MKSNPPRSVWLGLVALILPCAACGVSEPSDDPWQDVSSFSWPQDTNTVMRYKVNKFPFNQVVEEFAEERPRGTDQLYNGIPMFRMEQSDRPYGAWLLYAVTRDSLITRSDRFYDDIALVRPLVKGHSWTCGYELDSIPWRATIIDRYAYWKVDGRVYRNVIEVEYRPAQTPSQQWWSWVRFYAEGVGPVQTIKNVYNNPEQTLPQVETKSVLISSTADTN